MTIFRRLASPLFFLGLASFSPIAAAAPTEPAASIAEPKAHWAALAALYREKNILLGCNAVGANLEHAENPGHALQVLLIWRLASFWGGEINKWEKPHGQHASTSIASGTPPPGLTDLIGKIPELGKSPALGFAQRLEKAILDLDAKLNESVPSTHADVKARYASAINNLYARRELFFSLARNVPLSPQEAAPFFDLPPRILREQACATVTAAITKSRFLSPIRVRKYISHNPGFFYTTKLTVDSMPPTAQAVKIYSDTKFVPGVFVNHSDTDVIGSFLIAHEIAHFLIPPLHPEFWEKEVAKTSAYTDDQDISVSPYEISRISGLPIREAGALGKDACFSVRTPVSEMIPSYENAETRADTEALFLSCQREEGFNVSAINNYIIARAGESGPDVQRGCQLETRERTIYPAAKTRVARLSEMKQELCTCPSLRRTSANPHRLTFKVPNRASNPALIPAEISIDKPMEFGEYLWVGFPEDMGDAADKKFIAKIIQRGSPITRVGLRFRGGAHMALPLPSAGAILAAAVIDSQTCRVVSYNESTMIHLGGERLTIQDLPKGTKLPAMTPYTFVSPRSTVKHKSEPVGLKLHIATVALSPSTEDSFLSSVRIYKKEGDKRIPAATILGSPQLAQNPYFGLMLGGDMSSSVKSLLQGQSEYTVCATHSAAQSLSMECSNP